MDDWPSQLLADIRLSFARDIGPRMHANLLSAFGDSEAVLSATRDQLVRVDGIGPKLAANVLAAPPVEDILAELRIAERSGIEVTSFQQPEYPEALKQLDDAPKVIYRRGELLSDDQLAVAIVGTRHATQYGLQQAERLAAGLAAAGVTVVSGLARGIDAAAHRGALSAGGRTLAVLAGGLLEVTPSENRKLADQVAESGCLLSEAPPRRPPTPGSFPQRNRIISGLSLGVLVVEADERSGALITARHAAEQSREVFALPGPISSLVSRGCHRLIQEGAKLVTSVEDIMEELPHTAAPVVRDGGGQIRHVSELSLNEVERKVLDAIATSATEIDDVVSETGLAVHRVLATVSVLEMRHLIRRLSGTQVARV